jgi:hypothetical protein
LKFIALADVMIMIFASSERDDDGALFEMGISVHKSSFY